MSLVDRIPYLLPFFANIFLVSPPRTSAESLGYIKNHIVFLALFAALSFLFYWIREKDQLLTKRITVNNRFFSLLGINIVSYYLILLASAAVLFSSLGLLRLSLNEYLFYLILALFPLIALKTKFLTTRFYWHLLISFICDLLIGFIVFFIAIPAGVSLQGNLLMVMIICLAISCILTGHRTAIHLLWLNNQAKEQEPAEATPPPKTKFKKKKKKKKKRKKAEKEDSAQVQSPSTRTLRRIYILSLVLAPCLVGFLSFMYILPPFYMLTFLILYFCIKLSQQLELPEHSAPLPDRFLRQTTGICLLFAAMLFISKMIF